MTRLRNYIKRHDKLHIQKLQIEEQTKKYGLKRPMSAHIREQINNTRSTEWCKNSEKLDPNKIPVHEVIETDEQGLRDS